MRAFILLLPLVFLLLACKEEGTTSAGAAPSPGPASASTASAPQRATAVPPAAKHGTPQPKLPTVKLWVGAHEVTAEIASSLNQIATGMMWRTNMAEMEGMLFVFPQPQSVSFYMRNTLLPLSCAYLDSQGTVIEIYDMKPLDETPIPSWSDQIQYVLEMNQGWFERNNVRPGMVFRTEHGPFFETFFRRRR